MTDPGQMNRRLTLEAPVESDDGAGSVTRSYSAVATLWGSVTPVAARESVEAGALGATVTHRIGVRYSADITVRHRFRDGARIFRIVAMRERGNRRFLDIDAQERED
jgi:SPP1 family predicted phage head-tail adaptor